MSCTVCKILIYTHLLQVKNCGKLIQVYLDSVLQCDAHCIVVQFHSEFKVFIEINAAQIARDFWTFAQRACNFIVWSL